MHCMRARGSNPRFDISNKRKYKKIFVLALSSFLAQTLKVK